MKRFSLIVLITIAFLSCSKKASQSTNELTAWSITMYKSGCYGTCPIYSLKILANGGTELEAKGFMDIEGVHTGKLSQSHLQNLKLQIDSLNWSGYNPDYLTGYSDLPSTSFMFSTVQGDTFYLRYEKGEPPLEISELGKSLEMIEDSTNWVPVILD
jgi:hypothetical protein